MLYFITMQCTPNYKRHSVVWLRRNMKNPVIWPIKWLSEPGWLKKGSYHLFTDLRIERATSGLRHPRCRDNIVWIHVCPRTV